ncbi:MAG: response regulator transcription factor [Xanthomonadales bacterium]|nr:response regulator transcription factor [Xanthomonadales bacterium]
MSVLLVADDHPLFRKALAQTVAEHLPGAEVLEAEDLDGTLATLARRPEIDLVLLDLNMPGSQGLLGLARLRAAFPATAVMMVSGHEDPATIRAALDAGAMGFVPKRAPAVQLAGALTCVLDCRPWIPPELADAVAAAALPAPSPALRLAALTPQQRRVLELVARGQLNKQIADAMGIQERTVKAHLTAIFERLGVRNRTQAGVLLKQMVATGDGT